MSGNSHPELPGAERPRRSPASTDTRPVNAWGKSPVHGRWWKKAKERALGWVCPRVLLTAAVPGAGISQSAPATPVQQGWEHPAGRTGPPWGELAWKCGEVLSGKKAISRLPRQMLRAEPGKWMEGTWSRWGGRRKRSPYLSQKTTRCDVDTNRSELHKQNPVHPQATSQKQTSSNPAPEERDSPRKQSTPHLQLSGICRRSHCWEDDELRRCYEHFH